MSLQGVITDVGFSSWKFLVCLLRGKKSIYLPRHDSKGPGLIGSSCKTSLEDFGRIKGTWSGWSPSQKEESPWEQWIQPMMSPAAKLWHEERIRRWRRDTTIHIIVVLCIIKIYCLLFGQRKQRWHYSFHYRVFSCMLTRFSSAKVVNSYVGTAGYVQARLPREFQVPKKEERMEPVHFPPSFCEFFPRWQWEEDALVIQEQHHSDTSEHQ